MRELSLGHGPRLAADATATLAAGGKRLRPLLVLLCGGAGAGEAAIRAATAVELVHMATLVHDDVLDRAPLRRGRPTVAATSGRERASAVGDLLFSRAFALLSAEHDRRATALLSEASVALAEGELAQRRDAFDVAHRRAALPRSLPAQDRPPVRVRLRDRPGLRRGAGEEELSAFGGEIGLAFQLLDDVLDVSGPPERTGKARGTDLLDGTVTLPLILACERDPALRGVDLRGLDPAGAETLCDRIAATGVLEEVRSRALEIVAAAKARLEGPAFDAEQRALLELVADGVVERYS